MEEKQKQIEQIKEFTSKIENKDFSIYFFKTNASTSLVLIQIETESIPT